MDETPFLEKKIEGQSFKSLPFENGKMVQSE
jgi:hypothetical protein